MNDTMREPSDARAGNGPLSIERLHELFSLDSDAGLLRWRASHGKNKVGDTVGWPKWKGYLGVQADGRQLLVHRVIFAMAYGFWPKTVDHIDGDKANNCPRNLRAATIAENNRNVSTPSTNTSGVKGVCWEARRQQWKAQCRVNGRNRHVGNFNDLEAAAEAVRKYREQLHGEFARHE